MEMRCTTCGKEVTLLELYDGNRSCPLCRSLLADYQSNFIVTRENEELYVQAELLYANWLFNRDGRASLSSVEQAVRLCRQSASLGNPKALARLAFFYDKDYTGKHYSEVMRLKVAYSYYSAICYSGLGAVEVEEGLPAVNWKDLCEKTAYAMLIMLATAPAELQQSVTYSLRNNMDRILNELGVTIDLTGYYTGDVKVGLIDRVFSVFRTCLDKQRAPLFGVFRIKLTELKELYRRPMPGREEKIPHALYWLTTTKKVLWAYIRCADIGDSQAKFSRLSTKNSVESLFEEVNEEEYIWAFFFNHNGGHRYLSSAKKREKVQRTIYDRVGTDLLKMMLQNGNADFYTFYDDDIYQFMKQNNEADATRALVDKVCNGGNNA